LSRVGKEMTTDELTEIILRDKPFFDVSGGGVTLSGGEPTMYMNYTSELMQKLKARGIHTLLETCGQFRFDNFERLVLPYIDMIYYDIKIMDPDLHRLYCGVGNELIQDNFLRLKRLSENGGFSIIPRTPLIPNITDTEPNLNAIACFLQQLGVRKAQLLLYNPLWYEKNQKLGLENQQFSGENKRWQDQEKVARCESIYRDRGIEV
ncbi:MAG: radical SAM protein, partial [Ignavibacteriales bacterium]